MFTEITQFKTLRILDTVEDQQRVGLLLNPDKKGRCPKCQGKVFKVETISTSTCVLTQGAVPIFSEHKPLDIKVTKVLECVTCKLKLG